MNNLERLNCSVRDKSETQVLAHRLMQQLTSGISIGLSGALGAGKTTFVRYCAEALGLGDQVSSPTYVLQHEYSGTAKEGVINKIEHWDLYRLSLEEEELYEPPLPQTLRFIEWVERFPDLASQQDLLISITLQSNGTRLFRFTPKSVEQD